MAINWTTEQIIRLAPDETSVRAGMGLASSRKWVLLGRSDRALWGECQGSGASPYQTQIDLIEPAFRCTCPSRKFPCKHAIGLFLLYADQSSSFPEDPLPAWVVEWLIKREGKGEKSLKTAGIPQDGPEAMRRSEAAQERRAAERQARVAEGLESLEIWLRDLVREGLASAQGRPLSYWEDQAARMVDAQAPGVARWLRQMSAASSSGEGWQERLLEKIGLLFLLIEGYKRFDTLPEETRTDIRSLVGWTLKQEELATREGLTDRWAVVGQQVEEEETLTVQRTWLWGELSQRAALHLNFAARNQPLNASFIVNTSFEAELVFYPGAYPLRAIIKERLSPPASACGMKGYPSVMAMLSAYTDALSRNPWVESFPALLEGVIPVRLEDGWTLRDCGGNALPVNTRYSRCWYLLAISGGHPISVFAEWDGHQLNLLNGWSR